MYKSPWCEGSKTKRKIEIYKNEELLREEYTVEFCDKEDSTECKSLRPYYTQRSTTNYDINLIYR